MATWVSSLTAVCVTHVIHTPTRTHTHAQTHKRAVVAPRPDALLPHARNLALARAHMQTLTVNRQGKMAKYF